MHLAGPTILIESYKFKFVNDWCVFFYLNVYNHLICLPFRHKLLTDQFNSFITSLYPGGRRSCLECFEEAMSACRTMLDYVVQLGKICSLKNHLGARLGFISHSKKSAVHKILLHYRKFHDIHVSKPRWIGEYELLVSKLRNGWKVQQSLPQWAWDS